MRKFIVYSGDECLDVTTLDDMLDLNVVRCKRGQRVEVLYVDEVNPEPKSKLDIYVLDKILFPYDPIRDYVDQQIQLLEQKYQSLDNILEVRTYDEPIH